MPSSKDKPSSRDPKTAIPHVRGPDRRSESAEQYEKQQTSSGVQFDEKGNPIFKSFEDYNIFRASDMPEMEVFLVETHEPTGPYGAKAVAEVPISGPAPAIANAVFAATGIRVRSLPISPEKVWKKIKKNLEK